MVPNGVAFLIAVTMFATGTVAVASPGSPGRLPFEFAAWAAGITAVCGAFVYLARMVWRSGNDRATVTSDMRAVAAAQRVVTANLNGIEQRIEASLKAQWDLLNEHGKTLDSLGQRVASIEGQHLASEKVLKTAVEGMQDACDAMDAVTKKANKAGD